MSLPRTTDGIQPGKSGVAPYLLILPALILVAIFLYGMVNGVLQGFGIMPYLGLTELTLEYYKAAFTRSELLSSILYSLYLAGVSASLSTVLGVLISAVFTRLGVGRRGQIAGIQLPIMTAHLVVALFVITLAGGSGIFARVLYALGLIGSPAEFPTLVGAVGGWGIIAAYVWKETPFVAFCTLAIMGNISGRYAEAAASLGASPMRAFFSVTLPLSAPTIAKAFLIIFAYSFGSYELPFLLGPTLPRALPVLAYMEFTSPDLLDRAQAMALNGIMTWLTLGIAALYFAITQRERRLT